MQQRAGHSAIVQSPPGFDGGGGIARLIRSPVLRLEQVDVSTARDVKGVSARTEHSPLLARERHAAIADWTKEHCVECSESLDAVVAICYNGVIRPYVRIGLLALSACLSTFGAH